MKGLIRLNLVLIGIALYLMYFTFDLAHSTWQEKNKFASVFIAMMAFCFPVLLVLLLR
ncbi:Uncharacterised protein [Sporosarcina pasteurii]|uniref:Uncharacterized protein n=1 Tax=Sporosarcina pasteurii TaxID=1474 RepID=A0A380C4A2_SPOPA|nr:Uncharacterised protein [Sporosarcina pasteurii]